MENKINSLPYLISESQLSQKLYYFLCFVNRNKKSNILNRNLNFQKQFKYQLFHMISKIKKFAAQVSFRERRTTTYIIHTEFFVALFLEILGLSNIIIMAQRNNVSKFNSIFLFLLHIIRFEVINKISMKVMLSIAAFLFFYFFCFRNRSSYFGLFAKILPTGCAIMLIQIQLYVHQESLTNLIILRQFFFIILIIISIWIVKLMAFPQNYMEKQSKLTKFPIFLRTFGFIFQIFALIFKINIQYFLYITLILEIISLVLSLFTFQYICKDLEYLYFLGKYLTISVALFYLLKIKQILPMNRIIQFIPYAFFLFLFLSDFLKTIFQKKYNRILQKNNLGPSQIIILYNLLLNQKESNPVQKNSIFNFSNNNFAWNIMIKRLLNQQKNQKDPDPQQIYLIKSSNTNLSQVFNKQGEALLSNSQNFTFNIEYIMIWLEKQQLRLQSEFLSTYLCFSYLSQQEYLKSVRSLMKARKFKNYKGKRNSIYELIHFELENYKSIANQRNIIVQKQIISTCCPINQYKIFLELNHIDCIQMQLQLQELIKKMGKLLSTTTSLLTILNNPSSKNFESEKIKDIILQKMQQKQQIKDLIQKMHAQGHQNKKFIFIYYVYLNVCCSQSYTVFQKLQPLLQATTDNMTRQYLDKKSSENDMIVMVSIQEEYMGVIQHANIIMKSFFSLKQDRISSKTEHIQKIIPKFIASRHNEFLMKFKRTGKSNFIGQRNKLIVIQNQQIPYEVNIDIKMFVSLDCSVSLTSRIILIKKETNIVLFNSIGQIFENSLDLSMTTSTKRKSNPQNLNFLSLINSNIQPKLQKISPKTFTTTFKQKLARITIEILEIKGNCFGICKIKYINKILSIQSNIQRVTTQKMGNSLKSVSKESNCKYSSQNNKFLDLELRIQLIQQTNHPDLVKVRVAFVVFLIVSLTLIGYSFNYIEYQFIYSGNIAAFYTVIINGYHTRFFQMNNRYLLLHAINSNIIPDNIVSQYNISSFTQHIQDTTLPYLSDYDALDAMMITYSQIIPISYLNKFTSAIIDYIAPYKFKTSWISVLSLMKSYYHETIFATSDNFKQLWDNVTLPFNNYLSNGFFQQINNYIYMEIISKSITSAKIIVDNINGLIYMMDAAILLLIIIILLIVNKIHNQIEDCLQLMVEIDVNSWKQQAEKINLVKDSLKELTQTIIVNQEIQPQFESIKYYLSEGNILVMEHGQIYFQQNNPQSGNFGNRRTLQKQPQNANFNLNKKKQTKSKKQFERSGFLKTHLYQIIIIATLFLLILGMLMWSLTISNQIYNAVSFFYNYVNAIGSFRICQSIIFNIATSQLVLSTSPYINNIDSKYILPILIKTLFNRTHEDILKESLSWDVVSDFLYKSNCNQSDEPCKTLIAGTLNQNTPSAIMQFNNLNNILLTNIINTTDSSTRKSLLCQLWITYENYLRPILLKQQTEGLDMTNSKLSRTRDQLTIIFQKIVIPFTIILLLISYLIIHRMYKQLQGIKMEILMSDKVTHLITKVKFWNYLVNLK